MNAPTAILCCLATAATQGILAGLVVRYAATHFSEPKEVRTCRPGQGLPAWVSAKRFRFTLLPPRQHAYPLLPRLVASGAMERIK